MELLPLDKALARLSGTRIQADTMTRLSRIYIPCPSDVEGCNDKFIAITLLFVSSRQTHLQVYRNHQILGFSFEHPKVHAVD